MLQPKRPARTRHTPAGSPSLSEQLVGRAPHFKSFDHVTDPRARRAKEVEQFLLFVAEAVPEIERELRPLIADAHERGKDGRRALSVRDRILRAMAGDLPPATLEEFVEDLGLPYSTVRENLLKMAGAGMVRVTTRPREYEPEGKRGGARKPEAVFTLPG
jgi:hypothetical protein